MTNWLGLMIGNSRFHWALFDGEVLKNTFDCEHHFTPKELPLDLPLFLASVVPEKVTQGPNTTIISLTDIPLRGIYPTMGIDRALAVYGAGETWGFPCLVIDGGTALTFTGVSETKMLVGGAILPGLGLQLKSLSRQTAALPEVQLNNNLPPRWALATPAAIESGVIYTIIAGIRDFLEHWSAQFPASKVVLTGGDGELLFSYLQQQYPEIAQKIVVDAHIIFWGMRSLVFQARGDY